MQYGMFALNKHGHLLMNGASDYSTLVHFTTINGTNNNITINFTSDTLKTEVFRIPIVHTDVVYLCFLRFNTAQSYGAVLGQAIDTNDGTLVITLGYVGDRPTVVVFTEVSIYSSSSASFGITIKNSLNKLTFDSNRPILDIHGECTLIVPQNARLPLANTASTSDTSGNISFNTVTEAIQNMSASQQRSNIQDILEATNGGTTSKFFGFGSNNVGKIHIGGSISTIDALYPVTSSTATITSYTPTSNSGVYSTSKYLYLVYMKRVNTCSTTSTYVKRDSKSAYAEGLGISRSYYALFRPTGEKTIESRYVIHKTETMFKSERKEASFFGAIFNSILGWKVSAPSLPGYATTSSEKEIGFLQYPIYTTKADKYI